MRRIWKIVLVVAIALIVLGAALFVVALITGGSFSGLATRSGVLDSVHEKFSWYWAVMPIK